MSGTVDHLNGIIKRFIEGEPAFIVFSPPTIEEAIVLSDSDYDGVVIDMEHSPFSPRLLRDYLQYLLDRRTVLEHGMTPALTPLVRIPANGGEINQWMAKQVLDVGAYGILWPHIETVEQARNAVSACRYPGPTTDGLGARGYWPGGDAARYFGLSANEYLDRAGVWPLDPAGEILVMLLIESMKGVANLEDILDEVPGIGAVMLGLGDLSVELGYPGQAEHPEVMSAGMRILDACKQRGVACGAGIAPGKETLLERGFEFIIVQPERSYRMLAKAREVTQSIQP